MNNLTAAELFPFSMNQRNIWDLEQAYPGLSINIISTTLRVRGRTELPLLQRAAELVLAADPTLRTQLRLTEETPLQYHAAFAPEPLPVFDFSQTDGAGLAHWEQALSREALPLADAPLCRFALFRQGEDQAGLLIRVHHLISDGWTQALLCNRIGRAYLDLLAGREPQISPAPSYRRYVESEQEYLRSPACERDRRFWREQMARGATPAAFKGARGATLSPVGRRASFALPQVLNHAIVSFCRQERVAPFAVLNLALAAHLHQIGAGDSFCVGVPIFNRSDYQFKQSSGMFVSTMPFLEQVDDSLSFSQLNRRLTEDWLELLRRQRFPFRDIVKLAPGRGPLFDVVLSYQDSHLLTGEEASVQFSGSWHYSGFQAQQLCIHLTELEQPGRFRLDYDYLTQLYTEGEIEQLHAALSDILLAALSQPQQPLHALSRLSPTSREQVLYDFNPTPTPLPASDPYQLLLRQAQAHPQRAAAIHNGQRVSYADLLHQSRQVAAALPESGQVVAVELPRSPELLAAICGIMQANCAWLLLPAELPPQRRAEILRQSGANAIISHREAAEDLVWLNPRRIAALPPRLEAAPAADDDLAYLVYTSGSSGQPKGVEISRQNLLNLAAGMAPLYAEGAVLSVCSVGFDAFLLESMVALLCGRTILQPRDGEEEDPAALARLILAYGAGFLACTPSRLAAWCRQEEFRQALRRMESLVCGGEAFPADLLRQLKLLTPARIYNQYGPSETTVAVSYAQLNEASEISVGRPMPNCRLYVLDGRQQPLPIGAQGELYIGGLSVGRGYRGDPDLSGEKFLDDPFSSSGRLYRSGDIASWTATGQLMLAGRRDQQVKLRGLRVELSEVAACLSRHPQVRQAAARLWPQGEGQTLVAYYSGEAVAEAELLAFAGAYLPRYMLPSRIVRLPQLPLTANGKVDAASLPPPVAGQSAPAESGPPVTDQRTSAILEIFRQVLAQPRLEADSDYFLQGGDSLNAMETLALIEDELGCRLRVSDLYACRSAQRLAEILPAARADGRGEAEAATANHEAALAAPPAERYPLSPIQQNIYLQSCLDTAGFAYHMPGAFRLPAGINLARLEQAFRSLIAADDSFRTAFAAEADGLFARPREQVDFQLPRLAAESLEAAMAAFLRPFDLASPPLLRAAVWTAEPGTQVLLIDLHHLIGDGLSTLILLERLSQYYLGSGVAPPLTYKDYAFQLSRRSPQAEQAEREYWLARLTPAPARLELPLDHPRPRRFDFRGQEISFSLSAAESEALDDYCRQRQLTPFMLLAGSFGLLLSRLSGQTDIVLGTPVSDRDQLAWQQVCGPFLHTLPLRLTAEGRVEDYFQQVRAATLELLDHPHLSMDELISLLGLARSPGENPLFRALFSLRPLNAASLRFAHAPLEYLPLPRHTAKLDLSLEAARQEEGYCFTLEYATALFRPDSAALWSRNYLALLRAILKGGGQQPVAELETLSPQDRLQLIDKPNRSFAPFLDLPLHCRVSEAAALAPQQAAILWREEKVSFAQLEQRAAAIAGLIRAQGAQPGDKVALCCQRTPDLLAALLGILRTGCAYVPVLASYPSSRVRYMLENSGAVLLVTDEANQELLPPQLPCPSVLLAGAEQASPLPQGETRPSGEAMYVLYTSGSTGQPKGVAVPHRALNNLLAAISRLWQGLAGPVLCASNLTFDIFITESLLALAQGLTVVLADEEEMLLPWKLAALIRRHQVRIAQFTPSRLRLALSNDDFCAAAPGLEFTIVVGENMPADVVEKFAACCPGQLVNMYGPTEAAVYVTAGQLRPGEEVTIGRPLPNCRLYLLDQQLRPVTPTARGQLYLAGECLALGYLGQPELTGQVFLPDPFFPGQRMYNSGDSGRLRADGELLCLGRSDSQIKVNGFRVELDEIDLALRACGATQATTLPQHHPDGSVSLHSFLTPAELDLERLRQELAAQLPSHMLPAELRALASLPANASGKIDLSALGDLIGQPLTEQGAKVDPPDPPPDSPPESEAAAHTGIAAATESAGNHLAATLTAIWRQVLGREPQAEASFFDQGGSSLAALSVLSRYFNQGLSLTLAQFYDQPTLREQIALLCEAESRGQRSEVRDQRAEGGGDDPVDLSPCSPCHPEPKATPQGALSWRCAPIHLEDSVLRSGGVPLRDPSGCALRMTDDAAGLRGSETSCQPPSPATETGVCLLTGGSGFLGAHLLRELVEAGAEVWCLTRNAEGLYAALSWYFGSGWLAAQGGAIRPLIGDLTQPGLGLRQRPPVSRIFHLAADVRHYTTGDVSRRVNTFGTEQVIALAQESGARLCHVSTASVSGSQLVNAPGRNAVFTETDRDIGQNWRDNRYIESKFLAEQAVFAAREQGLAAQILRVGRLVGRAADGVFQRQPQSNALWQLLRGWQRLELLPISLAQMELEMTPVDVCAAAIRSLAGTELPVAHLIESQPPTLLQVCHCLRPRLAVVADREFDAELRRAAGAGVSDLAQLTQVWHGAAAEGGGGVRVSAQLTRQALAAAGFSWPAWRLETVLAAFRLEGGEGGEER